MSEQRPDPELLRTVFEGTEVLRKPISGIITGHHVLPYVLVGPHWDQPGRSVEVRGRIRVSPRLVLPVGWDGPTYGDVFSERELMHRALVARIFSFRYAPKVLLESEDLRIQRQDRAPQAHLELVLDELLRQESDQYRRDPIAGRPLLSRLHRPVHPGDPRPGVPRLAPAGRHGAEGS